MKQTLITHKTAKLAKERGFDCKHADFYVDRRKDDGITTYDAVPQSFLQKWLRDKHEIHVWLQYKATYYYPCIGSYKVMGYDTKYKTYEQALEEGLREGLQLMKQAHIKSMPR